MRFREVLSSALKDYKGDFRLYTKIMLLFFAVPSLIIFALNIGLFGFSLKPSSSELMFSFFGVLALFLFNIFLSASITASSLFNRKKLSEAISEGKKYFWKYLAFAVVFSIFLFGLFLLLIVPGVIFAVYWAFAGFVLIGEKKGIIDSLKGSYKLVRGRWWRVLGYYLLFFLVIILINLVFSLLKAPTGITLFLDALKNPDTYLNAAGATNLSKSHTIISYFAELVQNIIVVPLSLLFTKNFYLAMKKEKK